MRYRDAFDPFGAAEFFVTGVAGHEFAAPGVLRFIFDSEEAPGQTIVRVKLLMPVVSIAPCMAKTAAFLAGQGYELPAGMRLS